MRLPIYLDHNATTPVDPRVFEAMMPFFCETFGNAASRGHSFGWAAEAAVDKARQQAAAIINANPNAIVWTSGSTEANNLAIKGVACAYKHKGRHIITQATEHKAVLDPCKRLAADGYDVTVLGVDRRGRIDMDEFAASLRPDTILVSIMWANNEIGTIAPIRKIGQLCRSKGICFHTDATQAVAKIPIDVEADCIDLLSFSAHKMYGPKGSGALYVRHKPERIELACQLDGGGHERGYRSGTLNVPGIVGLGMACEIGMQQQPIDAPRLRVLRDKLEAGIRSRVDGVHVNGDPDNRLSHMTNLCFEGVPGDSMLGALEDIAVSSGSACTSASLEPSYVLRACGVDRCLAFSSLRFSLGRSTTEEEIDYAIEQTTSCITNLRALAAMTTGAMVK
ncbi:MAG: aminotransferase class V-fold PLP-dependent enzyme [Anaerolineae bacterium]|nr:aminotransferase class V-fold PLP-dependent enzyme [Phycisphaerae bacterium]